MKALADRTKPPLAQRLVRALTNDDQFTRIEAKTRSWKVHCPNGHVTDLWDYGGVRAFAKGEKVFRGVCPDCGHRGRLRLRRPG